MRCKVGDLVYCVGFGQTDPAANRGHVGEIVGPAKRTDHDWSVLIPGKGSGWGDGTWAARDPWLIPIRGDEEKKKEEEKQPIKEAA